MKLVFTSANGLWTLMDDEGEVVRLGATARFWTSRDAAVRTLTDLGFVVGRRGAVILPEALPLTA